MPYHVVMELALTGDPLPAERFHEFGVVNRLAEPGSARRCRARARGACAKSGPLALIASKRILQEQFDWSSDGDVGEAGRDLRPGVRLGGRQRGRDRLQGEAGPRLAKAARPAQLLS